LRNRGGTIGETPLRCSSSLESRSGPSTSFRKRRSQSPSAQGIHGAGWLIQHNHVSDPGSGFHSSPPRIAKPTPSTQIATETRTLRLSKSPAEPTNSPPAAPFLRSHPYSRCRIKAWSPLVPMRVCTHQSVGSGWKAVYANSAVDC